MRIKKGRTIRNTLRMVLGIAILGLAVNCPIIKASAVMDLTVKVMNYGAVEKAAVDYINADVVPKGHVAYSMDKDLQKMAVQLAIETLFLNNANTTRPNGESITSINKLSTVSTMSQYSITLYQQNLINDSELAQSNLESVISRSITKLYLPEYTHVGLAIVDNANCNSLSSYAVGVMIIGIGGNPGYAYTADEKINVTIPIKEEYFKLSNGSNLTNQAETYHPSKISIKGGASKTIELFNRNPKSGLNATGDGMVLYNKQATWESLDSSIAAVNENGEVTGVRKGTTTVTATYGGQTVSYTVVVDGGESSNSASAMPKVKSLKKLPKSFKGEAQVGGKVLYVENRKKVTGERKVNGKTYYYKNGVKANGNIKVKGKTYLYKNGVRFTGTKGKYYYEKGLKYTGWKKKGGKRYYYSNGKKVKGWQTIKKKKYYFNKKGVMQTGQVKIKGKYYYFNKSGVMQKNKWVKIDRYKYYFNDKGIRTKKKKA